jgi:hypothetical protein
MDKNNENASPSFADPAAAKTCEESPISRINPSDITFLIGSLNNHHQKYEFLTGNATEQARLSGLMLNELKKPGPLTPLCRVSVTTVLA